MKHVDVGPAGARIGYVDLPARADSDHGRPCVFVHGLGSMSAAYYAPVISQPHWPGRRALLLDLLGYGISDRPSDFDYSPESQADAVGRALDAIGVGEIDLVGHSMGGTVAIMLAARRPDLVRRLVGVEPTLGAASDELIRGHDEASFVAGGFAEALTIAGPFWRATMQCADPRALYRSIASRRGDAAPQLRSVLVGLSIDVAIIEGALTATLAHDVDFHGSGIPVAVIANAGHSPMVDQPAAFAQALARFLP